MTSCSFAWRPSCLAEVGGWGGNQLLVCAHSHRPSPGTWSPCLILYTTVQRARQHIGKQVFVVVRAASGGSGKMLLKCTAAAAITLYLHLYSNKLTRRWWWDGPTECSPNTLNLPALPKSHANIWIQFECAQIFFAKYLFRLTPAAADFRWNFERLFAHRWHLIHITARCAADVSSRRNSVCVCATTRIRFLQINFWLGLGAVAALLSRVWFYASLSHKIFAPINICRFTSWIGLMLSSARRELRWCKQMEF